MRGRDAPKIINVSVWSAAVMGALAFSISLGAYLFGGLGNQISADIEQIQKLQSGEPKNKCASGTMYTINNYPGLENLLPGGHAPYYLEGDKNWRCSYVCVPDGKKLKEYLSGSTIGGKEITLARDPDDFNNNIWPNDQRAAMTSTVILSQSVSTYKDDGQAYNRRCTGPNSTDYAEIKDANKNTVDVVERQESTYEETEAAREELTTGASTKEGAPESLRAPTTEEGPCPSCQRTLSPTDLETTRSSSLSQSQLNNQQGQCTLETLRAYINSNLKEPGLKEIMLKFANSVSLTSEVCQDQIVFIDDFNTKANQAATSMNQIIGIYDAGNNYVKGRTNNGVVATLIKVDNNYAWSTRIKISAKSQSRVYARYVYFRATFSAQDNKISPMKTRFAPYFEQETNWLGQPKGIIYAKLVRDRNTKYKGNYLIPPVIVR